jgi:hypothetical protein
MKNAAKSILTFIVMIISEDPFHKQMLAHTFRFRMRGVAKGILCER